MDANQELEVLFAVSEINGITVKPFKFKDFRTVLAIVKKYVEIFSTLQESEAVMMTILDRGEEGLEDVAKLTCLSTGLTREEIDELDGEQALDLFFAVFEVNADFFVQKLTAGAEKVAARLSRKGGESRSPASSEPDTDSTTSAVIANLS